MPVTLTKCITCVAHISSTGANISRPAAFDSVDRETLWRIVAAAGIPPQLLRLIKAYCASTKMKVRASGLSQCLLRFTLTFEKCVQL